MQWPETDRDWRYAVDAASGALALESARQYGLVQGGPSVNVERCEQILDQGKRMGIWPSHDAIEKFAAQLAMAVEGEL